MLDEIINKIENETKELPDMHPTSPKLYPPQKLICIYRSYFYHTAFWKLEWNKNINVWCGILFFYLIMDLLDDPLKYTDH